MSESPVTITMQDVVAEYHACRKAKENGLLTQEMFDSAKKLHAGLASLCLQHQVDGYNRLLEGIKIAREAAAASDVKVDAAATQPKCGDTQPKAIGRPTVENK